MLLPGQGVGSPRALEIVVQFLQELYCELLPWVWPVTPRLQAGMVLCKGPPSLRRHRSGVVPMWYCILVAVYGIILR